MTDSGGKSGSASISLTISLTVGTPPSTPTLSVTVSTDKASYANREKAVITVTVMTDGSKAVEGKKEAQKAAQELLERDPDFSVAQFAKTQPFRDASILEGYRDRPRAAGLPE